MKKHINLFVSILVLLTFVNVNAQENKDWKWSHQLPQGNILKWVKMWDVNNWYAVGDAGTFMKTTDAGANWSIHHNAGKPNIYDGSDDLRTGYFFTISTGLVAGAGGTVLGTTNGGDSFDTVASFGSSTTIYNFYFINSTTGYLAGSSYLMKTTNSGLNWSPVPNMTSQCLDVYASNTNNIIVSSSGGNVYKTTNAGTTWSTISTGSAATLYALKFKSPNTGFVTGSSGIFRYTINGGLNWYSRNAPTSSTMYDMWYYTPTGPVVTLDEGFTTAIFPPADWQAVNVAGTQQWVRSTGQYHSSPASAFINDDSPYGEDWLISPKLFISTGDSLAFWLRPDYIGNTDSLCVRVSTTDSSISSFTTRIMYLADGNGYPTTYTWQRYAVSLNGYAGQQIFIAFKHANANGDGIYLDDINIRRITTLTEIYLVGNPVLLFKTENYGQDWVQIYIRGTYQPYTGVMYSMDKIGNYWTAVGDKGIINKSSNNSVTWYNLNHCKSAGNKYDIWAEGNGSGKVISVGAPSYSTYKDQIIRSTDGGISWAIINAQNSSKTFRSISMANSMTGYICGTSGGIRKTVNGGSSWDSLTTSVPNTLDLYKIDFIDANTGWVFSNTVNPGGNIWKTTDGGSYWTQQDFGPSGNNQKIYSADIINANTGWLVNFAPTPYKTTNGGANWIEQFLPGAFTGYLYDICMVDENTGFTCGSSGKLFKTTNSGYNWTEITTPINMNYYGVDFKDIYNGFIVGQYGFTARTRDGGSNWEFQNTGGSSTIRSVYMATTDTGFSTGDKSFIFKYLETLTGVIVFNSEVPENFELFQNYPNPFNPSTTIKFSLPRSGKVTLKIYDITGRRIETLFNQDILNAGTFKYTYNASNLASGVYFYSLVVDEDLIDTKKMIFVK